ncbi:hypothetical protein B7P43_G14326, partial [Cryptotermes secundus]
MNAVREECGTLQSDKDKLVGLEGTLELLLDEDFSIQKAYLLLTKERDTLSSEHKELTVNFDELQWKCSLLTDNLNVTKGKCDVLQSNKDKLDLQDTLKKMLVQESSTQKAYMLLAQEGDILKSDQEELKVNFDELQRKCNSMTDNLSVINGKCDALKRDRDKLISMEDKLKMVLNEESHVQKAYLLLTQERDTLKLEQEELNVNFDEVKRKCSALTDNLNAMK